MKKIIIITLLCMSTLAAKAQGNPRQKNDTWYVWLHATATVDGKKTIVVSKDVFITHCCVNSPSYAKALKRSEKWMRKNIDPTYTGAPLQKVQDLDLAKQTLDKLKATAGVHIVDFSESCQ